MHRYFLEMAYKGTRFHGWQVQPNAISVQEVVDDALEKALREKVHIVGAGRTDTGVHASYFVAHFDLMEAIADAEQFISKINRILHDDVVIYSIQEVSLEAHSRFSAISRSYNYYLKLSKTPFNTDLCYRPYVQLDFDIMNEAAKLLLEYTDFTSFSKLHTDTKTNNCNVSEAKWERSGECMVFTIKADRFLRNMVRAIVGTLIDVGRRKLSVEDFKCIIEAKNRSNAGSSAQPQALFLTDIVYPAELFTSKVKKQAPL